MVKCSDLLQKIETSKVIDESRINPKNEEPFLLVSLEDQDGKKYNVKLPDNYSPKEVVLLTTTLISVARDQRKTFGRILRGTYANGELAEIFLECYKSGKSFIIGQRTW